ncbi:MAG: hypothetical protein LC114_13685 [Bryobacterales bacterium]|nr:hypothetical protein [Bryobacterales bacterium]
MIQRRTILTALGAALTSGCAAEQEVVRGITVHSRWTGVGTRREASASIRRQAGRFLDGNRQIEGATVAELLTALRAPVLPKPDPLNLGVTPTWVEQEITRANGAFHRETAHALPKQKELLARTLRDQEKMAKIVADIFASSHTDDYPHVDVEVQFANGERLHAASDSQHPFLLPWKIGSEGAVSYNAAVSRAVAGLLSEQAPNQARLAGVFLAEEIIGGAWRAIQPEWRAIGSQP